MKEKPEARYTRESRRQINFIGAGKGSGVGPGMLGVRGD